MTYPVNRACSPPCGKFRQRRQQQGELPFEKGSSCLVSRLNWPTREPEATALRGFSGSAHAIWLHGLVPPYSFRLLFASIRDGGSGVKREIFLLLAGEKALEISGILRRPDYLAYLIFAFSRLSAFSLSPWPNGGGPLSGQWNLSLQ